MFVLDGVKDVEKATSYVEQIIMSFPVVIFYGTRKADSEFQDFHAIKSYSFELSSISNDITADLIKAALTLKTGNAQFPKIYVNMVYIGSYKHDLEKYMAQSNDDSQETWAVPEVKRQLKSKKFDFDVVVIGGGSGGIAFAKEASGLGARVCLFDHVQPTFHGTHWGFGGTCVNVGCIPKKLMHSACIVSEIIKEDASSYGFDVKFQMNGHGDQWTKMMTAIGNHIKSLNFNYRAQVLKLGVKYINAKARVTGPNEVSFTQNEKERLVISRYIVLAVGSRPRYLNVEGDKDHCITSDDLFWLTRHPGKVLVVGAGYVAMECAGILAMLGCDVTVMVRSAVLRGFDRDVVNLITKTMESAHKVKFMFGFVPIRFHRDVVNSDVVVTFKSSEIAGADAISEYSTVLMATGRIPNTLELFENVSVSMDHRSGKIITMNEASSFETIFAIGDCAIETRIPCGQVGNQGKGLELTPVAIKSAQILARRLFGGKTDLMDYSFIPTTIYTPVEYGCVGYSEDAADRMYPSDVDVYHSMLMPFEWIVPHRSTDTCYVKLIVRKTTDHVLGFHYFGPHAGEVTQGFALGMKMGVKKADFNKVIGIHPTCAEIFTKLTITKSSKNSILYNGC